MSDRFARCRQAAEVIREQIEAQGETPKLLCLLGDATDDITCYQRAWHMSGEKFVRAVRSEGLYYYHRKQVGGFYYCHRKRVGDPVRHIQ